MGIRWEDDGDRHLLYFTPYYERDELFATMEQDDEGDYKVDWEANAINLCPSGVIEYIVEVSDLEEAKREVEDRVLAYYEDEIASYTEMFNHFRESVFERRGMQNANDKQDEAEMEER